MVGYNGCVFRTAKYGIIAKPSEMVGYNYKLIIVIV